MKHFFNYLFKLLLRLLFIPCVIIAIVTGVIFIVCGMFIFPIIWILTGSSSIFDKFVDYGWVLVFTWPIDLYEKLGIKF